MINQAILFSLIPETLPMAQASACATSLKTFPILLTQYLIVL